MRKLLANSRARTWLAIVGSTSLLIMTAYVMVQQSTRLSANDLPYATAQAAANALNNGANPSDVVPAIKTNLPGDTTPFVIITDNTQHILASSVDLDGQTPLPPSGVFDYAKAHDKDFITFQPASGVRTAIAVIPYETAASSGYIIAGQSLKQYESRTDTYTQLAGIGWLAILAWTTLALLWPFNKGAKQ